MDGTPCDWPSVLRAAQQQKHERCGNDKSTDRDESVLFSKRLKISWYKWLRSCLLLCERHACIVCVLGLPGGCNGHETIVESKVRAVLGEPEHYRGEVL